MNNINRNNQVFTIPTYVFTEVGTPISDDQENEIFLSLISEIEGEAPLNQVLRAYVMEGMKLFITTCGNKAFSDFLLAWEVLTRSRIMGQPALLSQRNYARGDEFFIRCRRETRGIHNLK